VTKLQTLLHIIVLVSAYILSCSVRKILFVVAGPAMESPDSGGGSSGPRFIVCFAYSKADRELHVIVTQLFGHLNRLPSLVSKRRAHSLSSVIHVLHVEHPFS
jgi:hypothetical protein